MQIRAQPDSQSCNNQGDCDEVFSYAMFRDLEKTQQVFTGLAAHRLFSANLASRGQTTSAEGLMVTGSYFPLLGIQPALGRLLTPDDDQNIGGHLVAVLSEVRPTSSGFENRRNYCAYVFGRLKPGVTLDQATTGINIQYAAIVNDVEAPLQQGMSEQRHQEEDLRSTRNSVQGSG